MKKVEAQSCPTTDCRNLPESCGDICICTHGRGRRYTCLPRAYKDAIKIVGENPNICQSHVECKKKGKK